MKNMSTSETRQFFIDYFKKQGHREVASSSLVPENDATLLFANAGMNQFKNVFLGLEARDYKRAVTSQKCVRAGGKHNDLENVGHTARHHTFFEMLGNFSFGDYFKKDAIHMAWDLLTNELGIPKEKLYVTVFTDDDEAADIWHKQEGVARDRIYRFGEKDNFWRMGDVGPCGPCSEIFYDHGPEADDPFNPSKMGGDGDRYVEIWNNVFMQYNEDATGKHPLPKPSVDTGGGLERWAAVLQGTYNNFNTDAFLPIINKTCSIVKTDLHKLLELEKLARHTRDVKVQGVDRAGVIEELAALRVLADHARTTAFLIADGVMPSNEGRGYVLRRIMRRAIRYGRKMTADPALFTINVQTVIDEMKDVYPSLQRARELIVTTVKDEVSRFITTLDQGTEIMNSELAKLSGRGDKTVAGDLVFRLYDTFGFPVDLTRLMAEEKGFKIDENGFTQHMDEARKKAKSSSSKFKAITVDAAHLVKLSQSAGGATVFKGYVSTESSGVVLQLSNGTEICNELKAGETGFVIADQTPFYAEGGGQAGDQGEITSTSGAKLEVFDCTKTNDVYIHHVRALSGSLKKGNAIKLDVLSSRRRATASNHSATHLLHAALRKTLGTHVTQAGSAVDSDRLRFDYTHNKPLSDRDIVEIEALVNEEISKSLEVATAEMAPQAAIEAGALALFGEKYGDRVRVVKMGEFSTELCGGTHVSNTAMIRTFKVVSESGVSAGVRRIEAITGDAALNYLLRNTHENQRARLAAGYQDGWTSYLSDAASISSVTDWIDKAKAEIKTLEREIKSMKGSAIDIDSLAKSAKSFSNSGITGKIVTAALDIEDRQLLAEIADKIKDKIQSGVVVLVGHGGSAPGAKHPVTVTVSKDLTKSLSAGKLLNEIAQVLGGKGGGRPDFAQGAGEDLSKVQAAFAKANSLVGA
jgi:alanyl-tRNA synthetase